MARLLFQEGLASAKEHYEISGDPHEGRSSWWAPAWLRRVLPDIRFSHT